MKTLITPFLLGFTLTLFAQTQLKTEKLATDFSAALVTENFDDAVLFFAPEVLDKMPAEQLAAVWTQLQNQLGDFDRLGAVWSEEKQDYWFTYQPIYFENQLLDIKLTITNDLTINGLFFVPHAEQKLDLRQTAAYTEQEITIETSKKIKLRGILTLPKKTENKVPVVVLVHGSGPQDMDETVAPTNCLRSWQMTWLKWELL